MTEVGVDRDDGKEAGGVGGRRSVRTPGSAAASESSHNIHRAIFTGCSASITRRRELLQSQSAPEAPLS